MKRRRRESPLLLYMDKRLYLENGYLNIDFVLNLPVPFIFVVGGRGTGKTYGALKYVLDNGVRFGYMRRTQAQADVISKPEFSPFKAVLRGYDFDIVTMPVTKYNAAYYRAEMVDDKLIPQGMPIGYTLALSTISNLRSFDMSDIELLIYDEFIPEKHERPLKHEADALWNAYETINRNRELSNSAPLKMLCLANANDLTNPIFVAMGIVDKVYNMAVKGQSITVNEKRGYAVVLLADSPISNRKRDTALYKLTSGSDYASMAVDNDYNIAAMEKANVNLAEYAPLFCVNGICLYKHKSNSHWYVTTHKSGGIIKIDHSLYKQRYRRAVQATAARGLIQYESIAVRESLLEL